ncbi:hypothetical protein AVEN_204651-1, partial [Araneus ventricosus]
ERKNSIKAKSESGSNLTTRRRSDESSRQTYRHPGSPIWYQNYPSIHSSVEDIHEEFEGRWKKMSVVSEKYSDHLDIPHEALRRQKSTPSPGSEKIPSCRDAGITYECILKAMSDGQSSVSDYPSGITRVMPLSKSFSSRDTLRQLVRQDFGTVEGVLRHR